MQRISIAWVIESFKALDKIAEVRSGAPTVEIWPIFFDAQQKLRELLNQSVYTPHLRITPEKARVLDEELGNVLDKVANDLGHEFQEFELWKPQHAAEQLRVILLAELAMMPSFLVTPKDNFSIDHLIDNGLGLFPADMVHKAPETFIDAQEASRCLAFDRNTACGFHTFRVVEAVLRRYWDDVAGDLARPQPPTLGKIASELKQKNLGDEKVREALSQLAKLHRNPIAHPDVILTADEAIGALGMARSVLTDMLGSLSDVPPTTQQPPNP